METATDADAGTASGEAATGAKDAAGAGATKSSGDSGASSDGVGKPDPAVEALKLENQQLRASAEKAARDAAASQAYVQEIVTRLQQSAEAGRMQQVPDTDAVRDRLNENPLAVLDEHFTTRMSPLIEQSLGMQAQQAEYMFDQRMSADEDYPIYKDELKNWMKAIPNQAKANPQAWSEAFDFIRAKHINEIVERRAKKTAQMDKRAFVEPGGATASARSAPKELNDEQRAIAKGLGIPEDEYKKWMEA